MKTTAKSSRASATWAASIGLYASLAVTTAHAEESHPALHWTRAVNAADCIDPRTLAELVETYTGPVLVAPASADASIESAIERTGPEEFKLRVSVTLTRGRPVGDRVLALPASECRKLDGAIAFVIASTLDPDLGRGALPGELSWLGSERPAAEELRAELAHAPPGEPQWKPQPIAAPPDAAPAAPPLLAETEEPALREWELGYALAIGRGRVPTATVGGLLSVARTLGRWFGLTLHLRGNANVGGFDVEAGRSIGVNSFDSALLACGRVDAHAYEVRGCLGPAVGFFSAYGKGFANAHTVVQPLYGGQLKLEASFGLADRLSLTAAGLFDLGFRRPTVNYQGLQGYSRVFRSELWGLAVAFGLRHRF
jgi:hypothetical protein